MGVADSKEGEKGVEKKEELVFSKKLLDSVPFSFSSVNVKLFIFKNLSRKCIVVLQGEDPKLGDLVAITSLAVIATSRELVITYFNYLISKTEKLMYITCIIKKKINVFPHQQMAVSLNFGK